MTATLFILVLLPIAYANSHFLLKRLKTRHYETWDALGTPRLGDSNLSDQAKKFSRFLWSGRFFRLNDPQLSFMCISSVTLWFGAFITFIYALLA